MRKRHVWVIPTLALLAVVPAFAGATTHATSHKVKLSGLIDTLSSTGTVGVAGSKETDTGLLSGTISGKSVTGAFYQTVTWGSGLTLKGNGMAFDPNGSLRATVAAKFTISGATESYTGTIKVTGGTGAYKGAHGTLQASGKAPTASDPDAATINISGTLKY
jgi:hypothetical protein